MNTENLKKEMKKIKLWHVVVLCTGIFLAFAIIGSIMLAAGGFGSMFKNGIRIGDFASIGSGELYEVDDFQELDLAGVDKIVIKTVSDEVTVLSGGDKVAASLKGQCRTAGKPVHLETRVQGGTAYVEVKYPNTIGFNMNFNSTRLTVTIPEAYAGDLSVHTVSGGVKAEGLPFNLGHVSLDTVSGGVRFDTASCGQIKVSTVSGGVTLAGIGSKTDVNTTSGRVSLDYSAFADTTVSTVSGGVSAAIPQDASFAVDFRSVSGGFRSSHPAMDVEVGDSYKGSANGGEYAIKVNTTSGSFKLEAK